MISAVDFMNNGKIPDWENSETDRQKYFAITSPDDELVPFESVKTAWSALGMRSFGAIVDVIGTSSPYGNTHTLISSYNPTATGIDKFHNATGVDSYIPKDASGKYIYDKAWEYLLTK